MPRRRSFATIVVLAVAVTVGLFAGSATAKTPTTCSSNPTICTWNGTQGLPLQQHCDAQNQPYLLWIFTTGGKDVSGGATLTLGGTGSGSYAGTAMGKEFHIVTPYFTPGPSLTAVVSYGGDLGNAQLTISHGCAGTPPPPPDTTPPSCNLTSYTTYAGSTEKSSITVTLQDSGSGIETVDATGTNDTITTSQYTSPTTNPVTVTATKSTQGKSATLTIVVTDAAGNQATCDPILRNGRDVNAHPSAGRQVGATVHTGGLTVHINRSGLTYGSASPLTLSGRVRNAPTGESVTILGQAVGFVGLTPIATVRTRAGGTFSYRFHPAMGAFYAVGAKGIVSPALRVGVKPLVQLTRTASGRYHVDVTTTNPLFLTGVKVTLQERRVHKWFTIARTRLSGNSSITEPMVVSSGNLASRKAVGHLLRAVVAGTRAYERGVSAAISG